MAGNSPNYVADGDINRSRFVKPSTTDHRVLEADANEKVVGISQINAKTAPIPSASTLAGAQGDALTVHGPGESMVMLELGGTVTVGDKLKSDADGKGVVVATSGPVQNVGAIALRGGASGELIPVLVHVESQPASASN